MNFKIKHKKLFSIQDHSASNANKKHSRSHMLKMLKMYLISRNARKQVAAVNTIMNELSANNGDLTAEMLIYTDIPGLLCDVMNNHKPSLIRRVISCLILLSKNKLFFQHKHSAVVVETTCRTVSILSKDVMNLKVIYLGLQLLSQTIASSKKESSVNLDSILGLIKDLLFNPMFQRVHMNVMFLLVTTMKVRDLSREDCLPLVHEALHLLYKLKTNNRSKFNKYIHLAAELIRLSLSKIYSSGVDKSFSRTKVLVMKLIKSCIIPYIQEVDINKCHAGFIRQQLNCLLTLYQYLDDKQLLGVSRLMAASGFLLVLPHVNVHFNTSLTKTVTSLMVQILVRLAVSSLDSSPHDCQLLSSSLALLPPDVTLWPQLLHESQHHATNTHHAILVYLYFVILCAKSFCKFPTFFPALCHYVKRRTSPPPPTQLKVIWLLYAVGSLSSGQVQSAGQLVVQWLRVQTVTLSTVYTHHPALLLWSFSSQVNNAIMQINIMSLWMRDKKEASLKEMETLALKNKLAMFRLMDVLGCCPQDSIPQTLTVIQRVLTKSSPDQVLEISCHIWSNLAPILSMLDNPNPVSRVNNVCWLVWLACKLVPAQPDTMVLVRLAYQLLRACRQPVTEPLLHCQLFKLAIIIAIKMNQAKDYRVLEMFLQDTPLLQALLASLSSGHNKVVLPALRLLAYLQYGQKMYNIKVAGSQYLGEDVLLQLMASPQSNTLLTCLQLFRSLQVNQKVTLVALPHDASHHLLRTLYLDFLMLSLKSSDSWRCQVVLLEFCELHNPEMEVHLLTMPWTYTAIQLALRTGGLSNVEVVQFLDRWLAAIDKHGVVPRAVDFSRAFCQDRLSTTLTHVAQALLQHNQINSLHYDLAFKVATIGGNIPPSVVKSLKTKLVRERLF